MEVFWAGGSVDDEEVTEMRRARRKNWDFELENF
jgi:hypothetical protein